MLRTRLGRFIICLGMLAFANHTLGESAPQNSENKQDSEFLQGEYLTTILSCGGCHTEGALLGQQTGAWLAGSKIGIAYEENDLGTASAVVFPSNLTSDLETGIGRRSKQDIIDVLMSGKKHTGEPTNTVMPWSNYRLLKPADIAAIATYLKALPAVKNEIPADIYPGQSLMEPYVRFGIYLFVPESEQIHSEGLLGPNGCDATPC